MDKTIEKTVALLSAGEDFVLATIFKQAGSAPRTAGARMIIRQDGSIEGTIGGGLLEARVMQAAPDIFASRQPVLKEYDLSGVDAAQMNMICGGEVSVLVDFIAAADPANLDLFTRLAEASRLHHSAWLLTLIPEHFTPGEKVKRALALADGTIFGSLDAALNTNLEVAIPGGVSPGAALLPPLSAIRFPLLVGGHKQLFVEPFLSTGKLFIFGGGHISLHLAPICSRIGFHVVVVDDREEFASRERFPEAGGVLKVDSFDGVLEKLGIDEDSYLVIVTRGHLNDRAVLGQALGTPAHYIGMIGSINKRDQTYAALEAEGATRAQLARVHSPIGISIHAETPEEIAVAIAAELIRVRAEKNI